MLPFPPLLSFQPSSSLPFHFLPLPLLRHPFLSPPFTSISLLPHPFLSRPLPSIPPFPFTSLTLHSHFPFPPFPSTYCS